VKEMFIEIGSLTWKYFKEHDGFVSPEAVGLKIEQKYKSLHKDYQILEFWMCRDRAVEFKASKLASQNPKWISFCGFSMPESTHAFLANGYQCWTTSGFVSKNSVLKKESHDPQRYFGDDKIWNYKEVPGSGHSWSYTILVTGETEKPRNLFYGFLTDDQGFGLFDLNLNSKALNLRVDVEGCNFQRMENELKTSGRSLMAAVILPKPGADGEVPLWEIAGAWQNEIRNYESRARLPKKNLTMSLPVTGYTSWYNRFTEIDQPWLMSHIDSVDRKTSWKIFQVDDGYQAKIGDWLQPGKGFPGGIAPVLAYAKERSLLPGVWLAPFVAIWDSELARNHPDWLARDEGKEIVAGDFAHWGGKFLVIDHENPDYQSYMTRVIEQFAAMGVKFIKADFLYASAMRPRNGKTRAELSAESHQWFYKLCASHDILFLSCGAPLSSAYGRCDFSRIGPDVSIDMEFIPLLGTSSREKPTVRGSIMNAVTRAILNGKAFWNDPDVVILRTENTSLTHSEKAILVQINRAFGGLLFCSDSPDLYGNNEKDLLRIMEHGLALEEIEAFSVLSESEFHVVVHTRTGTWNIDLGKDIGAKYTAKKPL
jgi:alpha-galactosidase